MEYKLEVYSADKNLYKIVGIDFNAKLKLMAENEHTKLFRIPARSVWHGRGTRKRVPAEFLIWHKENGTYETLDVVK